jgi:hypothetical protein
MLGLIKSSCCVPTDVMRRECVNDAGDSDNCESNAVSVPAVAEVRAFSVSVVVIIVVILRRHSTEDGRHGPCKEERVPHLCNFPFFRLLTLDFISSNMIFMFIVIVRHAGLIFLLPLIQDCV